MKQPCSTTPGPSHPPELLAPAGDADALQAAVACGADAVYFGVRGGFNARAKAGNFTLDELSPMLRDLRRRGVRGYLTLNTLVFVDELPRVETILRRAAAAGIDGVLVQDLAVARLLREICPAVPLHASTQMTLGSAECIAAAAELGLQRVVLPRELSLDEIAAVRRAIGVELEVFVHGALCMSYSGQCLASLELAGRSANRGICAQICRTPFQLSNHGRETTGAAERSYALSPRDLAAYELVPELIAAGVDALKIEGRMKSAEYVAAVTRHYRRAIDAAWAGTPLPMTPEVRAELELAFSRGFSPGWLRGPQAELTTDTLSSHRGTALGVVAAVERDRVAVRLSAPVRRGDGIVFEGDRAAGAEQGGRVYEVFVADESIAAPVGEGVVALTFARGQIDFAQLRRGQAVWKTDDPALDRRLRRCVATGEAQRRVPVDLHVVAAAGAPLRVRAVAATGAQCAVQSPDPLVRATRHPLNVELLREQLGRLGGTAYELRGLTAEIEGEPLAPLSVLGRLRRALIDELDRWADAPVARTLADEPALPRLREGDISVQTIAAVALHDSASATARRGESERPSSPAQARLHVLCRTSEQVAAAVEGQVDAITLDWLPSESPPPASAGRDGSAAEYSDADAELCAAAATVRRSGIRLGLAGSRIHSIGAPPLSPTMVELAPDFFLVRNLAALRAAATLGRPAVADFSLNAANDLAIAWLCAQGAARVTASLDVDARRAGELIGLVEPGRLEIVLLARTPLMHARHDFRAASATSANRSARAPADAAALVAQDRRGERFPLVTGGGYSTLFAARQRDWLPQAAVLRAAGCGHFRLELLSEDPRAARVAIDRCRRALAGD